MSEGRFDLRSTLHLPHNLFGGLLKVPFLVGHRLSLGGDGAGRRTLTAHCTLFTRLDKVSFRRVDRLASCELGANLVLHGLGVLLLRDLCGSDDMFRSMAVEAESIWLI